MGESKHDGLAIPGRVVLAHEPPFDLGRLRVVPPIRQVLGDGRSETVEPRVMQALVALARANGEVVIRDELIERCWDGRIVSDDAINRVLSRIRQIAAGIGGGSFAVETIPRVGYRLVARTGEGEEPKAVGASPPAPRAATGRRAVIAGGAAALALGAGAMLWRPSWNGPSEEAQQLYRRGALLSREGLPGQVRQSVSYFERAAALDPDYPEAWGALALSYSHLIEGHDSAELASLPGRIRSAARRALQLDPGNADARLALIFITPFFGHWAAKEAELRRVVESNPGHWLAHGRLALLLYQVGRLSEGIDHHRRGIEIEPMLPVANFYVIRSLSALGRTQEADSLIQLCRQRWPTHPGLWSVTFKHLLLSGRPKAAAAFLADPDTLPVGFGAEEIEPRLRLARALDSRGPDNVEAAIEDQRRTATADVHDIPEAASIFAALGRPDLAFASLERYYFNRGDFGPPAPIGPYARRYTDFLFAPPLVELVGDPRFGALLRDTGLDAYWRQTGTLPDHRR